MEIDEKKKKKYLNDPSKCPYCYAPFKQEIVWQKDEWMHNEEDGCQVRVHYYCYSCDRGYYEIYHLSDIEPCEPEPEDTEDEE